MHASTHGCLIMLEFYMIKKRSFQEGWSMFFKLYTIVEASAVSSQAFNREGDVFGGSFGGFGGLVFGRRNGWSLKRRL
ncbi:hypothetical protein HPP92_013983 [Vanilla planifolia]|uniref:Uncharacterized protein n=1 Tax=Vanilla planifolia TaxID=51239 RepID=A0A835QUY1_VANPL|nr:hypothetical protein HPP92_013983 [Vanilla planifolia]